MAASGLMHINKQPLLQKDISSLLIKNNWNSWSSLDLEKYQQVQARHGPIDMKSK